MTLMKNNEKGQSLIEVPFIILTLLSILFGILQLILVIYAKIVLNYALTFGAREILYERPFERKTYNILKKIPFQLHAPTLHVQNNVQFVIQLHGNIQMEPLPFISIFQKAIKLKDIGVMHK